MKHQIPTLGFILSFIIILSCLTQNAGIENVVAQVTTTTRPASTPATQPCNYYNPQAFSVVDASWGKAGTPVEAGPGSQMMPLVVTLQYGSDCMATTIRAEISLLPSGFTDTDGATSSMVYLSNVPAYSIIPLTFYLNVAPTVTVGSYIFPLHVSWNNTVARNFAQSFTVAVQLRGAVELSFNSTQTTLNPGQVNTVTVRLDNVGSGDASQVEITVAGPPSVSILNQIPEIPAIESGSGLDMNLSIYVSSAAAGSPITAVMTAKYTDAYGNPAIVTQNLGFYVPSIQYSSPISVNIQPSTLTTGTMTNVTISVANNGETRISNISVSLLGSAAITWLQSSTFQHELLLPGQSFSIQAQAYEAQNAPPSVSTQVSLIYYDVNGIIHQESQSIGLLSLGIIDLRATDYTVLPDQPVPGSIFSITTTLTNLGTVTASSLSASPQSTPGFTVFGTASYFIGDLPVSTPTPFTISLSVDNDTSAGTHVIPITLTYFDNLRQKTVKTVNLNVTIGLPSENPTNGTSDGRLQFLGSPLSILIIVLVVVIVVISWLYLRRRSGNR